jgi:hypothetical protein
VADKYDDEIEKVLEPYIYEIVCEPFHLNVSMGLYPAEYEGSISAEHGLGKTSH